MSGVISAAELRQQLYIDQALNMEREAERTRARYPHAGAKGCSPFRRRLKKIGRNEPCPCGSGRKYKHCHLGAR